MANIDPQLCLYLVFHNYMFIEKNSIKRHYVKAILALYLCRDELKRHYTLGEFWVEVEMEDLASFDEDLSDCLYKMPTENLPLVSLLCSITLFYYFFNINHS